MSFVATAAGLVEHAGSRGPSPEPKSLGVGLRDLHNEQPPAHDSDAHIA